MASSYPWLRPPATPLVTHDPYFCIWSFSDHLYDDVTHHWTGARQPLTGVARIDGKPYRFMGMDSRGLPVMPQVGLEVWPTNTIYSFEAQGMRLEVTFTSPLLPGNLDLLSRPLTYITLAAHSVDGAPHSLEVYFSAAAVIAVDNGREEVTWARYHLGDLGVLSASAYQQRVLERSGDNLRIEWGSLYLAAPQPDSQLWPGFAQRALASFVDTASFPGEDDLRLPRAAADEPPALNAALSFGQVNVEPVTRTLMLAYDDRYSLEFLNRRLRPYWRRNGMEAADLLKTAWAEYQTVLAASQSFDQEVMADLAKVGGEKYAVLCALAYRQAVAAHKLAVDFDGTPVFFSKENFSNGCIDTVDVFYPSAPLFLLFNPALLRAQLVPMLVYAASPRWPFPFAPHDLGQYPLANGQVYGGGEHGEENQMPVEESGNMLILLAALAQVEGNAETVRPFWPVITKWAGYLREKGLDPENQLCTDDFAGHLAHNVNLSVKAILGLGAYAQLADRLGDRKAAQTYHQAAQQMAAEWRHKAADGDHYRLTFDLPGSWSQKYNLVWDRLLGLNLFPADVAQTEIKYYLDRQNQFGLPLDSRKTYTKLDWIVWTACLVDSPEVFRALTDPLYDYANRTPDRVPLADWYETTDGQHYHFRARSVVGGVFIKALTDPELWKKWLGRASGS